MTDVSQFKNNYTSQGELLKQAFDNLNKNMTKTNALLEQIEKNNFSKIIIYISNSVKNLFKNYLKK
jgi:flagellar hook-basal body complex protein FliE